MPATSRRPKTESNRAMRARMRAMGMKPITIWVPDPKAPGFAEEMRRQSRLLAESPGEAEDQAFVDSLSVAFDDE